LTLFAFALPVRIALGVGMARPPAPCGTLSAYKRHKRKGEPVDQACMAAMRADSASRAARVDDDAQSAPIVALPGGSVEMPEAPHGDVDARAELLANMALVKKAMEAIAEADPLKIVTLSKRHSELVDELVKVSGTAPPGGAAEEADPFAFLGDAARRSAPAPRKSS
jgi:hypothetical protein